VIAKSTTAPTFAPIARYLAGRGEGSEPARVAWISSRNLVSDEPALAADVMQATAGQSPRVETPAYHLTLSFAPEDRPTRELMEQVVDRTLADLGITEHQALLVAHHDREHRHVHILANRVHSETLATWDQWHDHTVLDRSLAAQERELGLRRVVERDERLADQSVAPTIEREPDADRPLIVRVRPLLPEIRTSRTWDELRDRLAAHDLSLERRAHGLAVTDGTRRVKASQIAADVSLARLEARFGPYPGDRVPEQMRAAERSRSPYDVAREVDGITQRLRQTEWAVDRADRSAADTARALADTYRDPNAAAITFLRYENEHGADRAARALREHPEQFGTLVTVERRRFFGLWTSSDDRAARASAIEASGLAREWTGHARQSRNILELEPGASADAVRNALTALRATTHEQLSRLRDHPSLAHTPRLPPSISKELGRAISDSLSGRDADRER
jgi:hypothetical protein